MMFALKQAGADIAVRVCNVDSTDDGVAARLVLKGISVYGWYGVGGDRMTMKGGIQ
jgi:S-adenosylhomocysteine hydrolase